MRDEGCRSGIRFWRIEPRRQSSELLFVTLFALNDLLWRKGFGQDLEDRVSKGVRIRGIFCNQVLEQLIAPVSILRIRRPPAPNPLGTIPGPDVLFSCRGSQNEVNSCHGRKAGTPFPVGITVFVEFL